MRALPVLLAVLLVSMPAMQVYGGTMADAHCRTHGHLSNLAPDAEQDSIHAQHHAADAGAQAHHAAAGADAKADGAHCQCGCLCDAVCAGGAVLSAWFDVPTAAPLHEPWQALTDMRHPVSVHDSLLRPPRLS